MIVCPWNTSFATTASALSPAHKKQLQCVIQQAPSPRVECAPVVIPGLRRPWGAAMQVMVRMRRRRRSTIGNHVAYATVFSKPPVAPIQHIHTALGMQLLGVPWCHRAWRRWRAATPVPATHAPSHPHAPNVMRGLILVSDTLGPPRVDEFFAYVFPSDRTDRAIIRLNPRRRRKRDHASRVAMGAHGRQGDAHKDNTPTQNNDMTIALRRCTV